MRTFYSSPFSSKAESNEYMDFCRLVQGILKETAHEAIPQKIWSLIKRIFECDLFLWSAINDLTCQVYPPIGSKAFLPLVLTSQQGDAVLKQGSDRIMRIIDQKDNQLISLMLKESPSTLFRDSFTVLYLRQTIYDHTVRMVGFASARKNAYNNTHVAYLFKLADIFEAYWKKTISPQARVKVVEEEEYFPISQLPNMENVLNSVLKISRFDFPVLLLGETGTGKEGVADHLYRSSVRYGKPFVKINCGSIPSSLIESRLFGHEKGAFTSAESTVKGCFERADKGVLFMDEVAELSLPAQIDILRAIQENVIERVGGTAEIPIDIRIIAATNRNINQMVLSGEFREDLYYRLNIFPILIPPLRERKDDLLILTDFFIEQICRKMGLAEKPILTNESKKKLLAHTWQGNIRELMNAVIRAIIPWSSQHSKYLEIIPQSSSPLPQPVIKLALEEKAQTQEDLTLESAIKKHILKVLNLTHGKVSGYGSAAELLNLPSGTLRGKMKKYGIK